MSQAPFQLQRSCFAATLFPHNLCLSLPTCMVAPLSSLTVTVPLVKCSLFDVEHHPFPSAVIVPLVSWNAPAWRQCGTFPLRSPLAHPEKGVEGFGKAQGVRTVSERTRWRPARKSLVNPNTCVCSAPEKVHQLLHRQQNLGVLSCGVRWP